MICWPHILSTFYLWLYHVISIRHNHYDHSPAHQVSGAFQVDASQEGTGDNHAISALKFKILQEFLELNWHVLLSDVDIVTLQVHDHSFICRKACSFAKVSRIRPSVIKSQ